ncbi:peptidase S41 [Bradyrhizobium macuxiense]|uniref:Peptidase S41 n=1 Tax=Bradyrhizobium macuxiense TaxID=1755647 RepID=A0A120FH40_9BRAD|nr:S41 family peptidase [Bradyrhizobium macuxiense]KWV45362.1 peptidase S41 [Bradyrhizobium macuxiense]
MKTSHFRAIGITCAASAAVVGLGLASRVFAGPSTVDLGLLSGVMQLVQEDYVHPVDSNELTNAALKGMLSRLDPHSAYMTEPEFRESREDISGKFGGIGLQITYHNGLPTVLSPIDDTPGARAGLQPGDAIVSVDGQTTRGVDLMDVIRKIRGKPGTVVRLTILRDGKSPFDVPLTRQVIEVYSVKSRLESNNMGYLRISEFGQETPSELRQAISNLQHDAGGKLAGVVLDLRNDPGGLLASAVDVSSDFLNGGTVVSIRGRNGNDDQSFTAPATGALLPDTPVVVLVNGASASASEIVAGALQDRHRATVMGTQSFGKGSVQTIIPIKGHGALRLTTALYYTPSGRSIQGDGITPDVVVQAAKDEQVANSLVWREAQLHGAFTNPGTLSKSDAAPDAKGPSPDTASPPIKEQLIGTDKDSQLKAALNYLEHLPASKPALIRTSAPG